MENGFDIHKFVWKEFFVDHDGKTSASAFIGFICCAVAILLFAMLVCFYMFKVVESIMILKFLDKILILFGIGSGLLGVKSLSSSITGNTLTVSTSKKTKKCKTKEKEPEECQPKPLNETVDSSCSDSDNKQ